jgi:predicted AlkP superfamily phosphohydrolase/phosphomutase
LQHLTKGPIFLSSQIQSKVLVVGLDGATFDIISPLIAQGKLPNLAKIASAGVCSKLRSTILPLSPTAWTSFASGKNAGKHGIYDFSQRTRESYSYRPTTSLDSKTTAIWEIIGSLGAKSIVVNVPLTYPPKPFNGVMISGFPTPSQVPDYTYPRDLLQTLEEKFGKPVDIRKPTVLYRKGREREITNKVIKVTQDQTAITAHLMKEIDWNLVVSVYDATDVIGHYFWAYLDKNHPKFDKKLAEPVRALVEEVHIELDKTIGELAAIAGSDSLVMVISDHGFGPVYYGVYINNWLLEQKYMRFKRTPTVWTKYQLYKRGLHTYNILQLAKKLRLVRSIESAYSTRSFALNLLKLTTLSMDDIDWNETKVYSAGNFGQLYVNLAGREPNGIVPKQEATKLIDEVRIRLGELKDPKTGRKLFDHIYKRDDVFIGVAAEDSPDIVFFDDEMKYSAHRMFELGSNKLVSLHPVYSGNHRMDGIFFASGKSVKHMPSSQSSTIVEPDLIDLAPTLLHYMGTRIPKDMDGKILVEYFDDTSEFARRQIQYSTENQELTGIRRSLRKLKSLSLL